MSKQKNPPMMYDCEGALEDVRSMLSDLAQEMHEWFDNMPENLQGSAKGDAVNEAADALDSAEQALEDAPECASAIPQFAIKPMGKSSPSRSYRCGYACSIIGSIIDSVNEYAQHSKNPPDPVIVEELLSWVESLDQAKDEAEAVEFPGMYG